MTHFSRSCADLAFWCGCVEEQIDRIFRSSALMRDKWDRMTGDATYGQITIRNAVASCAEIYRPVQEPKVEAEDEFRNLDISSIRRSGTGARGKAIPSPLTCAALTRPSPRWLRTPTRATSLSRSVTPGCSWTTFGASSS